MNGKISALAIAGTAILVVSAVWIIAMPVGHTTPDSPADAKAIENRLASDKDAARAVENLPLSLLFAGADFAATFAISTLILANRKRAQMERGE